MTRVAISCCVMWAMAVLLGNDGQGGDPTKLDRVELVELGALVATAAKFDRACETVEKFREADEAATAAAWASASE